MDPPARCCLQMPVIILNFWKPPASLLDNSSRTEFSLKPLGTKIPTKNQFKSILLPQVLLEHPRHSSFPLAHFLWGFLLTDSIHMASQFSNCIFSCCPTLLMLLYMELAVWFLPLSHNWRSYVHSLISLSNTFHFTADFPDIRGFPAPIGISDPPCQFSIS